MLQLLLGMKLKGRRATGEQQHQQNKMEFVHLKLLWRAEHGEWFSSDGCQELLFAR